MRILVSACLLGRNCKYSGGNNLCRQVCQFVQGHEVIAVCPEEQAGLGVPRTPMEMVSGALINKDGVVVDGPVRQAVEEIVNQLPEIDLAILKARSPTCGVHQVYDGSFSGELVDGAGVLAQKLLERGIIVKDEEEI